MNAIVA